MYVTIHPRDASRLADRVKETGQRDAEVVRQALKEYLDRINGEPLPSPREGRRLDDFDKTQPHGWISFGVPAAQVEVVDTLSAALNATRGSVMRLVLASFISALTADVEKVMHKNPARRSAAG